jgi:rare lipoprotein A
VAETSRSIRTLGILALLTLTVTSGCSRNKRLAERGRPGFRQTGVASWYGPGFHGKRTANGEIFDMDALTAAHKQLPFDTVVLVESHDTRKSVRVRINDRGPFVRGRILDLSRAAAERLDLIRTGTATVTLQVIRSQTQHSDRIEKLGFLVQAGAFRDLDRARSRLEQVRRVDRRSEIASDHGWHRVVIGPFRRESKALELVAALERQGIEALVREGS